ncbi:putative restriction endonuclease [Sphingomonas guangdongensis]|uniref:Putative restriction endonuclease n=1 Tax=Sphingomonas guangdongensis TaxID=1141890 RepID=A0A285QC53_9SPHN|nr:HNH endonuclease [Sphingomonas guangdongensis]SOB79416.1 putative restriction endonuclease [Sphingomonas guangdongensis]
MALGVFVHRTDSIYDDSPAERYQFPAQYLGRASACVGDWVLYYEPVKVRATRGYFAVARVQEIIPDPLIRAMYVAVIEPGSYLEFANPVSFNGPDGLIERRLLNEQQRVSGRAQSAVRPISTTDFNRILDLGLGNDEALLPRIDHAAGSVLQEERAPFAFEHERERITTYTLRIFRDRVFRKVVLRAYGERCAITGLRIINGGGRAEAEAAHIRPVEANGPDIVTNGLALSGTVHWMFDRGLISLSDDLEILVSRQANDPDSLRAMINRTGRALPTIRALDRPHPHFMAWHREHCFKL